MTTGDEGVCNATTLLNKLDFFFSFHEDLVYNIERVDPLPAGRVATYFIYCILYTSEMYLYLLFGALALLSSYIYI